MQTNIWVSAFVHCQCSIELRVYYFWFLVGKHHGIESIHSAIKRLKSISSVMLGLFFSVTFLCVFHSFSTQYRIVVYIRSMLFLFCGHSKSPHSISYMYKPNEKTLHSAHFPIRSIVKWKFNAFGLINGTGIHIINKQATAEQKSAICVI